MAAMYTTVLLVHSWLRWAVLLFGLLALVRAIMGSTARRPWGPLDDRVGLAFIIAIDVQILLGLLLYFVLSPITEAAMADFGAAMGNSVLRFWAVEHVFGTVIGAFLAHRGRARVRKMTDPIRKHKAAAVFIVLALVAILASIPWPGTPNARPLFRW
jgi:hypothetical protein